MNSMPQPAASGSPWLEALVTQKEPAAEGIVRFELRPIDHGTLPSFSAGSHIDVRLPNGAVRQYSLCNDPQEHNRYEIGILLDPAGRGGSRSAHEDLRQGDTLQISPPRNHFPLHTARRSLLLAGGIGVTPMLSMAEQLSRDGADFRFHYCARSVVRMAYRQRIQASAYADRTSFHFDDGSADQRFDARQVIGDPDQDCHLYVCGPSGFMDHVIATARELGWAETNIHFEYFAAPQTVPQESGSFEVKLATSGKVVKVAADKTIAQALADAGVSVPMSCEQGICGTCLVGVIEGEPDHRDFYLSDEDKAANKQITLCCSRAHSPCLVLDL